MYALKKQLLFLLALVLCACSDSSFVNPQRGALSSVADTGNPPIRQLVPPPFIILAKWFDTHPVIASSIKWQFQAGSTPQYGVYDVAETDKISWPSWSASQKNDLSVAYTDAYNWYFSNYDGQDPIPTIPNNMIILDGDDSPTVARIPGDDAWQLYVRWVAHALMVEMYHLVPWSVTTYDAESLALLFDSSRFFKQGAGTYFNTAAENYNFEPQRRFSLGATLISAPIYTYKFLYGNSIMNAGVADKRTAIKNMLTWCSNNMTHFYGSLTFGNANAHWQFYGPPPFVRVAEGTTSPYGFSHWTAGCGGTSSFIGQALRAVNIPVQMAAVCEGHHYVPLFPTEGLFMDHGDDPYNQNFKNSGASTDVLLLDAPMFSTLFGISFTSPDNPLNAPCANVGLTVINMVPSVDLKLNVGATASGTITAELRSSDGVNVISSVTMPASSLPKGINWVKFNVATQSLIKNQPYRIYVTRSGTHVGTSTDVIYWMTNTGGTDAYPQGINDVYPAWTLDYSFRTYSAQGAPDQKQETASYGFATSSGVYHWQEFVPAL